MIMDVFDTTGTESGWPMQESGYDGLSSDLKQHQWELWNLPCETSAPVEAVGSFVKPIPKEEHYDGLSSNLKQHQCGEYLPCSAPVEAVGSFVKPIPKEEQYVLYSSELPALPIEESTTGPDYDTPSLSLSAPKTLGVPKEDVSLELSHHHCHPIENAIEAPPTIVSTNEKPCLYQKESMKVLSKGRTCNIMGLAQEMTNRQNAKRRRSKPRRRHVMDKYCKLFLRLVLSGCLPISLAQEGAVGLPKDAQTAVWQNTSPGTCFPCMDITCQNLKTVYGPGDILAYQRNHNETFPECSTISFSPNSSCNTCLLGQPVMIICPEPFPWLDVEGDTSEKIYPKPCPTMETTQNPDNTFTTQGKPFLTVDTGTASPKDAKVQNPTLDSDNSKSIKTRLKRVHFISLGIGIPVTAMIVFSLVYYCICIKKESTDSVV